MSLPFEQNVASLPSRRSLPLKDFDYSSSAAYFVTFCVEGRLCLFGAIAGTKSRSSSVPFEPRGDAVQALVTLNDAGKMVLETWRELPTVFPGLHIDESTLMPNHLHGIVILSSDRERSGYTLGDVVGRFKTFTSHRYRQGVIGRGFLPYRGRLWQRDYYEHVIRDDRDLDRVRKYVVENPCRWAEDEENPDLGRG